MPPKPQKRVGFFDCPCTKSCRIQYDNIGMKVTSRASPPFTAGGPGRTDVVGKQHPKNKSLSISCQAVCPAGTRNGSSSHIFRGVPVSRLLHPFLWGYASELKITALHTWKDKLTRNPGDYPRYSGEYRLFSAKTQDIMYINS